MRILNCQHQKNIYISISLYRFDTASSQQVYKRMLLKAPPCSSIFLPLFEVKKNFLSTTYALAKTYDQNVFYKTESVES